MVWSHLLRLVLELRLEFGLFSDFSIDKMTTCQFEISTDEVYKPRSREKSVIYEKRFKLDWCVKLCPMRSGYHLQEESLDILGD